MSETPIEPYDPFGEDQSKTKRMVAEKMAKTREAAWKEVARQIREDNRKIRKIIEEDK